LFDLKLPGLWQGLRWYLKECRLGQNCKNCIITSLSLCYELYYRNLHETVGDDRMIGPLGKVVSPFRPTARKKGGDLITTLRRRDVGAVVAKSVHVPKMASLSGALSLALLLPFLISGPDFRAWPDCWVPPRPHPSEGVG